MHANTTPARLAGRREWVGLAVLALPCLLYAMDLTVLNLAVPHLSADLRPSSTQLLWITDIYGFLVAGCLITMGTLGDRIGRRRLLLAGAAAFGVASALAAGLALAAGGLGLFTRLGAALPAGVPGQAAAAARDTLGGAVAVAGQLPGQLGQALLGAAREAFTQGLHLAFAVSAAATIGAAIAALMLLRRLHPSDQVVGSPT